MKRLKIDPRFDWKKKLEDKAFTWHSAGGNYWNESACYEFSSSEIDEIESATNELYSMCLTAVQHVIDNNLFYLFKINPKFIPHILNSWNNETPSIYGRFDLAYDGVNPPKMLEFNADTPTSLYEAAVIQWEWLNDYNKNLDQFNSIHEKLVGYWKILTDYLHEAPVYFSSIKSSQEDFITTSYMQDCAMQAGLETAFLHIEDIGWDEEIERFTDLCDAEICNIFKLYPWEWIVNEEFGDNILKDPECFWIEASWKMILSNKAILPILWELFPNHKNLLPSFFDKKELNYDYVRKPLLSREGANVEIVRGGMTDIKTGGDYGEEGYIKQQLYELPYFDGNYPVIGSWVIGGESAGIGIRESSSLITDNTSTFVPHYFV